MCRRRRPPRRGKKNAGGDFLEDAEDFCPDKHKRIWLVREYDGEELYVYDEEEDYDGSDFLRNMLIAAEIISVGPGRE
jgi:hypothetical protein